MQLCFKIGRIKQKALVVHWIWRFISCSLPSSSSKYIRSRYLVSVIFVVCDIIVVLFSLIRRPKQFESPLLMWKITPWRLYHPRMRQFGRGYKAACLLCAIISWRAIDVDRQTSFRASAQKLMLIGRKSYAIIINLTMPSLQPLLEALMLMAGLEVVYAAW